MVRLAAITLLALALAAPADAQLLRRKTADPTKGLSPEEAAIWPYPLPDPKLWWDEDRLKPTEASDPFAGRRLGRGERLPSPDNGVDPATYRLWGLMPLQWQPVRGEELILEVWARPSRSVRQAVIRVTVRRDGDTFVQGRAGLACCEAGIGRRMGFDAKLPAASDAAFKALRDDPLWAAPRDVVVDLGGGVSDALCVDGVSYDLTLVTAGAARTVRRACDSAEIGQAADVLAAVVGASLGRDGRFDLIFPRGADFSAAKASYQTLTASGGGLKTAPVARRGGVDLAPPPQDEASIPVP
ncbi:hypothetical protein [Phenylobacterium immobile]|uniref:hypothetical protein n=1 Tax=Phenylobacterium immobile TaxID=21 RepID=UPI000AB34E57|nr:hypothetical protein [Phenylobacterium immobile]